MHTAFTTANMLLPNSSIDYSKWSVIACDQYTSQPKYWQSVEDITKDSPSTLNLILPEVYLNSNDCEDRIAKIHSTMNEYLTNGVFTEHKDCFVYVERTQSDGKVRKGLIGAIDLEQYDYTKGSTSQVRATESTVIERIPPRLKVRTNAPIELTHIMILIDDANNTVIEPIGNDKASLKSIYSVDLMLGGGHIDGYLVDSSDMQNSIDVALNNLLKDNSNKYSTNINQTLLYAMGDGNHSLATAKAYYENLKKSNPNVDYSNHPSRYALVEIVNLHSEALQFEAIHRIVTNVDTNDLLTQMNQSLGTSSEGSNDMQRFCYVLNGIEYPLYISKPNSNLTVGSLQNFLDLYLKEHQDSSIDYIHGKDVVLTLSKQKDSIGFILPDMAKEELFDTVIKDGSLPRKTFSMGHAEDKRYYMECRTITE